jgi:hypothetical protein
MVRCINVPNPQPTTREKGHTMNDELDEEPEEPDFAGSAAEYLQELRKLFGDRAVSRAKEKPTKIEHATILRKAS